MLNDDFASNVVGKALILCLKDKSNIKEGSLLVHEMIGVGYSSKGIFILQTISLDLHFFIYNFLKFFNLVMRNFDSWYDIIFIVYAKNSIVYHNWWKEKELYECLSNIIIRVFSLFLCLFLKCKKIKAWESAFYYIKGGDSSFCIVRAP